MPPPWNGASGEPEVPPDIPPEYADAYLAGFRRGLGGLQSEASGSETPTEQVSRDPGPESTETPTEDTAATVRQPRAGEEPARDPSPPDAQPEPGGTDLEWLFDRRESGPPGWTVASPRGTADDTVTEPRTDSADPAVTPSGATSVAGEGPRSPWPLLGAFVAVLLLLMLLAYLGGMAFSTIMNR